MDEIRSAYGLLNLKQVDAAIEARHKVADYYRQALRSVKGVKVFEDKPGVRHNYSYFPILIDAEEYGMSRDELYFKMRDDNVLGRRYFYPLISTFDTYKNLESSNPANLPVATRIADEGTSKNMKKFSGAYSSSLSLYLSIHSSVHYLFTYPTDRNY